PRELFLDSDILFALESLKSRSATPSADAAPRGRSDYTIRRCPKCNQVVSGEWTFCPTDGTPVVGHVPGRPSWTQSAQATDAPQMVVDGNGSGTAHAPRAAEPPRVAGGPRPAVKAPGFGNLLGLGRGLGGARKPDGGRGAGRGGGGGG